MNAPYHTQLHVLEAQVRDTYWRLFKEQPIIQLFTQPKLKMLVLNNWLQLRACDGATHWEIRLALPAEHAYRRIPCIAAGDRKALLFAALEDAIASLMCQETYARAHAALQLQQQLGGVLAVLAKTFKSVFLVKAPPATEAEHDWRRRFEPSLN